MYGLDEPADARCVRAVTRNGLLARQATCRHLYAMLWPTSKLSPLKDLGLVGTPPTLCGAGPFIGSDREIVQRAGNLCMAFQPMDHSPGGETSLRTSQRPVPQSTGVNRDVFNNREDDLAPPVSTASGELAREYVSLPSACGQPFARPSASPINTCSADWIDSWPVAIPGDELVFRTTPYVR